VSLIVLLDAGPLGMLTNPKISPENEACKNWLANLTYNGVGVVIPEIADYEVRRELIRAGLQESVNRLDRLKAVLNYLPINTDVMLKAAELWAQARNRGTTTAAPKALDADVILAAQALHVAGSVATENVEHLSLFVDAKDWRSF